MRFRGCSGLEGAGVLMTISKGTPDTIDVGSSPTARATAYASAHGPTVPPACRHGTGILRTRRRSPDLSELTLQGCRKCLASRGGMLPDPVEPFGD
jgi:hypothetical protein